MFHIGELGDMKRPLSGWLSLVLFVLMIPLTNWVIMNVGLVKWELSNDYLIQGNTAAPHIRGR